MQLWLHRTPILKCTSITKGKMLQNENPMKEYAWCWPCSKGVLASTKLGECCPPSASCSSMVLDHMQHGMKEVNEKRQRVSKLG
jgi:hypothetical protein